MEIQRRQIGKTGIKASVIGLGTFAIGGWFWGGTDERKAIDAIKASIDLGINLVDTAPIYGFGLAEEIVGKALKGAREKAIIATKVGLRWNTDGGEFDGYADERGPTQEPSKYKIHRYLSPDSIVYEIEQTLRRLQTDYIDLYQTHWQEKTTPIEATMEALVKLRDQGKIRAIGVSNVSVEQLKKYGDVASDQEKFSLMDRSIVDTGIVDYCVERDISILSYFTLEQGLLTGKMDPTRVFPDGDTRKANRKFSREGIEAANSIVSKFQPFADKYDATLPQIVLALTARQPGITHLLVGARNREQAEENFRGGCLEISDEDVKAMNTIANNLVGLNG